MTRSTGNVARAAATWLENQQKPSNISLNAFISHTGNDSSFVEKLRDSIGRHKRSQCLSRNLVLFDADEKQTKSLQL